jgi:hypothetical protein
VSKPREDATVTRRADLIKAFFNARDQCLMDVSEIPKCFGGLPQGNESAWAKGCKECPLYLHSDACSKATKVCQDIYWHGADYALVRHALKCTFCEGIGYLLVLSRDTRECPKCHGKKEIVSYTMEKVTT